MPAPLTGEKKKILSAARGRGNQGDWVKAAADYNDRYEDPDARKSRATHNLRVTAKKEARAVRRAHRDAVEG